MYLYYSCTFFLFFFFSRRGCSTSGSPFIFPYLYPKCKLVTIRYWTMFNNTINTRVMPDASFLLVFPLPLPVTCNGHTLFSCDFLQLRWWPSSLFPFLLTFFLSLSLHPCFSFSLSFSVFLQWLCPSAASFAIYLAVYHSLFPPVFLPGSYYTDLRHCNQLDEMHFLTTVEFLR